MRNLTLCFVTVVLLASCRQYESSVTGSYGSSVLAGEVVMTDGSSPAGVEISAGGMFTTLGADGRFVFAGVSDQATLHFHRGDGIDTSLAVAPSANLHIELSANEAKPGRRRGVSPAAKSEYEGVIRQASATSIVLFTSHQEEVTIAIDAATIIRKGNTPVAPTDLKTNDRVHIKATMNDGKLTATEIVLQNESDDDDDNGGDAGATMTANGLVLANDGSSLKVQSQPKGEVTVKTDGNTIIKRQGERITAAEIKTGDEVNAMGTRVDDHTMLALQIEVRGNSKKNK